LGAPSGCWAVLRAAYHAIRHAVAAPIYLELDKAALIFKSFGNEEERAFLPCLKAGVSCPKIL